MRTNPLMLGIFLMLTLSSFYTQATHYCPSRVFADSAYKTDKDSTRGQNEECINAFRRMEESMSGLTENGNKYSLYAYKMGKQWTYLVLDSTGYFSIKQKKNEELQESSMTYTDMVCLMTRADMIRKKDKSKTISGLSLNCYYKFRPQGKKMYRSVNKMINQADRISNALKDGPKGLKKLFL